MGCGTGRWAKFIAPKVGKLHCIDPSNAIYVAKKLQKFKNVRYHQKSLDSSGLKNKSGFWIYVGCITLCSNARAAIKSCAKLLKPGLNFAIYLLRT